MIIVTGATGQLGGAIVERLLERIPADQIGVSVRDPDKARHLRARGVRVRRGEFGDPTALARAFEGATQVLIVSGPADPAPHRAAIEAARAAGARRILYTSHMGANRHSLFAATGLMPKPSGTCRQPGSRSPRCATASTPPAPSESCARHCRPGS